MFVSFFVLFAKFPKLLSNWKERNWGERERETFFIDLFFLNRPFVLFTEKKHDEHFKKTRFCFLPLRKLLLFYYYEMGPTCNSADFFQFGNSIDIWTINRRQM